MWIVPLVVALLTSLACSDPNQGRRQNVEIWDDEAAISDDGRSLRISIGTCNGDPEVVVVETADEVRLTVESYVPGRLEEQEDCLDGAVVELDEPLGARTVVDTLNGDRLTVIER